jgi:predicted site-specific integrase-resolvase
MDQYSNLFLNSEAVAHILRVSPRTLQNYRSEGKLIYYKVSRKNILYRVGDVVDFLKQSSCCSYQKDRLNTLLKKYLELPE